MKRHHLPILLLFLLASTSAWGRPGQSPVLSAGVAGFDTNIVFQIHDNGYFRSTVTNYGYFGTVRDRLRDSTGALAPVLESPPHSKIEYLYEAGLWIGGIVGNDTLVSSGSLGFGQSHELYADSPAPAAFSDFYGDVEWTFNYGDTTTEPETVRDDQYDGPHRPLPVRVRQKTYTFDAPLYNGALYMEIVITNVGAKPITDAWFGWMIDPDIGHQDRRQYWMDDITGHIRSTVSTGSGPVDVSMAWAMDNDGDPDSTGQFDTNSAKSALGSMYLGGSPRLEMESYNWWVPSLRDEWDWGPQRAPGDTNIFGGRGYAVTDAFRYRLLSNRELDYAQPFAAVDRTSEGWMTPTVDTIAREYADGYDTRFLHSVGPATLAPGDSVVIHWVWGVSAYAHTQPSHFANTFDAADPQEYLDGLGIDELASFMADLKTAWDSAFSFLPIAPPRNFHVAGWNDTSGVLTWNKRNTRRLTGYLLSRSTDSLLPYQRFLIPGDTSYLDAPLDRSQTYYYRVASAGRPGSVGGDSRIDSLLPDRPQTPAKPVVHPRSPEIVVQWTLNPEPGIRGYRVYRRLAGGEWTLLAETDVADSLVDGSVVDATAYEYRITAVSALANESYPSPAATGVVFAFDGPPQIVDYTMVGAASLTDKDSVSAVWARLLGGAVYRDASSTITPYALLDFNPHPVTVVVSDGRSPLPETDFTLLDLYSNAQGATIISGRDLFNRDLVLDSMVTLPVGSIGYAAGIRRAYYPRLLLANPTRMNAEFVAAAPYDRGLPRLDVDSARTGWGLNPALPHPGNAIPFVGYFDVDTSRADVLYTFVSKDGAASPLHGKPVAVMAKEPGRTLAIFAFPLSYIEESDARACVAAVLSQLGYGSTSAAGDADNDGVVTAADVVFVINYLYRGGYLIDEGNADVNGDCRVDVLDVVYLADFVYGGITLPTDACAP